MRTNQNRKITRLQFGSLLCHAWELAATTGIGIAAFKSTSIFPLNRLAIPSHAYTISDISSVENPPEESTKRSTTPHPSTSQVSTESRRPNEPITPNKAIKIISPIPVVPKPNVSKRKQSGDVITTKKIHRKEKIEVRGEKKNISKQKPRSRCSIVPTASSSSSESLLSLQESGDSLTYVENECVECLELYKQTRSTADWIKCVKCGRWLHETCSVYANKCSACGRLENRRLKNSKLNL